MDFSERLEELTSTLGGLCQDYRIPVDTESSPRLSSYLRMLQDAELANMKLEQEEQEQQEEQEEEEFQRFCQSHTYLMGTNSRHLGYSTLPLPPNRGERKALAPSSTHPKRSQSYQGHHMHVPKHYATLSFRETLGPRKSYPQSNSSCYDKKLLHETSYPSNYPRNYRPRPLSYQEISYDENDYEENLLDGNWSELSCP